MKWDEGIPYQEIKKRIIRELEKIKTKENIRAIIKTTYLVIYSIQLRNGCRISEAIEGFNRFLQGEGKKEGNKRIVKVRVRKKKKPEEREIIYPEFISYKLIEKLKKYRVVVDKQKAIVYCKRYLGVNTHTLRYARITYLAEKGVNPSIIAKITKHSKLDFIITYTQEKLAKKINMMIE